MGVTVSGCCMALIAALRLVVRGAERRANPVKIHRVDLGLLPVTDPLLAPLGPCGAGAQLGFANTSNPLPVSNSDFRLDSTIGQPWRMPVSMPLPGSSSSWVTVNRTMSW